MPPSERKPITLPNNNSHFTKRVFISAFIFTAAILLIWLIRNNNNNNNNNNEEL